MQYNRRYIIEFGKISCGGPRKIYATEVEIILYQKHDRLCLSICGDVWNSKRTDIISGGQNLDCMKEDIDSPLFNKIYEIWKKYHLNDMHAGTERQEKYLDEIGLRCAPYEQRCEELEKAGLLTDTYEDKPYIYGHGWTYREIPEEVLKEIEDICDNHSSSSNLI